MIEAKILADSVWNEHANPYRLTTFEVTFPRFILAEFNTHRVFSRNSASSRAIPTARQIELIEAYPFVPKAFSINKPGMSATEYVHPGEALYEEMAGIWFEARDDAVKHLKRLTALNVHKQHANRIIEPYMWHQVIISATELDNFWNLRISPHAQPEINETAAVMKNAYDDSEPTHLYLSEWHLPLVDEEDRAALNTASLIKVSTARVAAVSYNRHNTKDWTKEFARYDGLASNTHLSPFEHPATPSGWGEHWANFNGYMQARWLIEQGRDLPT